MSLEIKYNEELKEHLVFFNGEIVGSAEDDYDNCTKYHGYLYSNILHLSKNNSINAFFNYNFCSFSFDINVEEFKQSSWIGTDSVSIWFEDDMTCFMCIHPNFLEWDKPFSILNFLQELDLSLKQENIKTNSLDNLIEEGIIITFNIDTEKSIFSEYNRILKYLNDVVYQIFSRLEKSKNDNELFSIFSFPKETKQACEQYLVYFSKFLQDLGIEAISKIDSQTKTTFFTVIPLDSGEALINIKKLLDIYLSIPQTTDLETFSLNYNDVSAQQLIANVYHLKSQLTLANSIIQNKEATIESLKLTTIHQNLIIDSKKSSSEEKALDGLVTIGEFEWKGLKVNLAEVFRRLKRKFTK